jgi:hypothetical protein
MIERLPRILGAYLAACFAAGFVVAVETMLLGLIVSLLEGRSLSNAPVAGIAGLIGGLVNWLIAGRTAGAWRGAPAAPLPSRPAPRMSPAPRKTSSPANPLAHPPPLMGSSIVRAPT